MSELIRRQDAELILAREMYATSLKNGCDPVSPVDFLPEAKAWMSDAPAIVGWISCSERLPENEHIVLLTIQSTLSGDLYVTEAIVGRIVNEGSLLNGVKFYTERYGDINEQHGYKVIAWMPLPEPYEAS
jgi:hypothetical protein